MQDTRSSKADLPTRNRLAQELIERHPTLGRTTAGRLLYKENPAYFITVEDAVCAVRRVRGSGGGKGKSKITDAKGKELSKVIKAAQSAQVLPKPVEIKSRPFRLPTGKWLILSDVHVPFFDHTALQAAIDYGVTVGCDSVLLNGDFVDLFDMSDHERNPTHRFHKEEIKTAKSILTHLEGLFKQRVYKFGNHEERWMRYFARKAPELLGIDVYDFKTVFGLDNWAVVEDRVPITYKNLSIVHGHEWGRGSITSPASPARTFYLRSNSSCLGGHHHRKTEHSAKKIGGKYITCWSTGCLCQLNPHYAAINQWTHGFAVLDTGEGNYWEVHNKQIIEGKVLS